MSMMCTSLSFEFHMRGAGMLRRRRVSQSDDDDDEEEEDGNPAPSAPIRTVPKRSAYVLIICSKVTCMNPDIRAEKTRRAVKAAVTPIKREDSDEEEQSNMDAADTSDDDEEDGTPMPRRPQKQRFV